MRKIMRIVNLVLIIFVAIISLLLIQKVKNSKNNDNEMETVKKFREFNDHYELAYWVAIKNGDWSDLPLTDVFRKKYNEKDGIFGKMQFDKVEYRPYHDGKYPFEDYAYLVVTQGKKKTAYTYGMDPDSGDGYNDIIIGSIYPLTDENGNEVDFREGINEKNFIRQMDNLAWGNEDEQCVGVTGHFHQKYPYFLDLFIHYSPLGANEIKFDGGSFDDRIARFEVDSIFECKIRYYEVRFELDDKGYLDDAAVELKYEESYKKNNLEKASASVFYKNSNWDYLKLTNSFRNKYRSEEGVFKDIDKLNISIPAVKSIKYDGYWMGGYKCLDGSIMWLYEKYYYDDKDYLDDAEIIIIDYDGMDPEKAKEIYLSSISE